jgi:hypothetical protein
MYMWICSFNTLALDGGEWSTPWSGCWDFGKEPPYPLNRRMSRPQGQSGQFWRKSLDPARIQTPNRPACRWLLHYTIPAPECNEKLCVHSETVTHSFFGDPRTWTLNRGKS